MAAAAVGGFWDDLVNLQTDRYHYTGLLSLKPLKGKETISWGEDLWLVENGYKPCHIVDGQQRITTFVILLNEIVGFVRSLMRTRASLIRKSRWGMKRSKRSSQNTSAEKDHRME